jgi:hypothetical protein
MVEDLDGGRGVVHRRRQGPDRDVDQDPHGEAGVLLDGPLDTEGQIAQEDVRTRRRAPVDLDHGHVRGHEVADAEGEDQSAVVPLGLSEQAIGMYRLDGSGPS